MSADSLQKSPWIAGLLADIAMATRIAKAAKLCHLRIHNFDRVDSLLGHMKEDQPRLLVIDWDKCEAKGFRLLQELQKDDKFRKMPIVGYVSQSKHNLKDEARIAGCDRVYSKTQFLREIDEILARNVI